MRCEHGGVGGRQQSKASTLVSRQRICSFSFWLLCGAGAFIVPNKSLGGGNSLNSRGLFSLFCTYISRSERNWAEKRLICQISTLPCKNLHPQPCAGENSILPHICSDKRVCRVEAEEGRRMEILPPPASPHFPQRNQAGNVVRSKANLTKSKCPAAKIPSQNKQ